MPRQHKPHTTSQATNPWDQEAEHFDDASDHGLNEPATRSAWQTVLLEYLRQPPATVVDLGCGTGSLAVLLAQAGFEVRGIDSSPAMLDRARVKAADASVSVDLTLSDAAHPPMPGASVDIALCRHVLWALPDPVAVLRRWVTLLKPGGQLVLIEGRWDTGTGITAEHCADLLIKAGRQPTIHHLTDPALWGRSITDERYLIRA